jgi:hypothetical protein
MKRKQLTVIKSVSFKANCSVEGRFNHVHIEAAADVPIGVSPRAVLEDLKEFVATELKRAKDGDKVHHIAPPMAAAITLPIVVDGQDTGLCIYVAASAFGVWPDPVRLKEVAAEVGRRLSEK